VGHFEGVIILEDKVTIEPPDVPLEIAEASKRWDEAAVFNWLAPHIPRAMEKAKANPESGIY